MKELMLHVERIVRPVRALQSRKLRMRRELLAHMQSAVDQERAGGADEATAVARAKERMGEPADLTRSLQASVPRMERALLSRMPGSDAFDRFEKRSARFWGLDQSTTLWHAAILILGTFALTYTALLMIAMQLPPYAYAASFDRFHSFITVNLLSIVLFIWLLKICADVCLTATLSTRPFAQLGTRGIRIMALMLTFLFFYIEVLARHLVTPGRLQFTLIVGVALIASLLLLGGSVRLLRRRYEQWLTLDIAG